MTMTIKQMIQPWINIGWTAEEMRKEVKNNWSRGVEEATNYINRLEKQGDIK